MRISALSGSRFLSILGLSFLLAAFPWGRAMASGQAGKTASLGGEAKLSQAAAERKLIGAGKEMMEGRKLVLEALRKAGGVNKEAALKEGAKLMAEGDKMIQEAERMLSRKQDTIKAEGLLMEGSTKMMEGKDRFMEALDQDNLGKLPQVKRGEKLLGQGFAKLLDAKNALELGEKNSME